MPWLDPRVRCNCCGTPFDDESLVTCPGCNAELRQVGTQCELRDWGATREQGRSRYIWRQWVFKWGGLMAGFNCVILAWRGESDPVMYSLYAGWLIGGYVIGLQCWGGAEREYAAWLSHTAEPKHAKPL